MRSQRSHVGIELLGAQGAAAENLVGHQLHEGRKERLVVRLGLRCRVLRDDLQYGVAPGLGRDAALPSASEGP
jgi:hypothetical protein